MDRNKKLFASHFLGKLIECFIKGTPIEDTTNIRALRMQIYGSFVRGDTNEYIVGLPNLRTLTTRTHGDLDKGDFIKVEGEDGEKVAEIINQTIVTCLKAVTKKFLDEYHGFPNNDGGRDKKNDLIDALFARHSELFDMATKKFHALQASDFDEGAQMAVEARV